ncbi:YifB family Mg chelatase-like AAA ATPase [Rarobacter incanus]|uniref:Magnesium chelatase family protein n=1 Tax=Rarobacter incanus TaxID=153494 RepID=A0A542SLC3_9MICO|nr:YifB family Mg chelatase-like AAA ATPase [Rarobacter incanus]TQK75423.1 magnesium chelatase family protein [Rarobacter incanus]
MSAAPSAQTLKVTDAGQRGWARAQSVALVGVVGHVIDIEVHLGSGIPGLTIVGLPDASLSEAKDRVRAAMASTGVPLPQRRITVNLAPASLPKRGSGFDLAIALSVLIAAGMIQPEALREVVVIGELGLDGSVHGVRGILPAVVAAANEGIATIVVPAENAAEACLVPGMRVIGAQSLGQVASELGVSVPLRAPASRRTREHAAGGPQRHGDMADVIGQPEAKLAIEVAAAGGHNLLMTGEPGVGKTMLASRLPTLLPDLTDQQSVEVTSIHSLAGEFDSSAGLIRRPPFQAPHHTATAAAIVGGGSGIPRPGAISLAHHGVLFLDEAPEFSARVLQTLRQPLEAGELTIHRSGAIARFPASFQLVMAANPCPCGKPGDQCGCTSLTQRRYFSRLSGPLLDRVDLYTTLTRVSGVRTDVAHESSRVIAARVARARDAAAERLRGTPWSVNGNTPGSWLRSRWRPDPRITQPLDQALTRGHMSLRAADRVVKVAWTLADLDGEQSPNRAHIAQAVAMRTMGPA